MPSWANLRVARLACGAVAALGRPSVRPLLACTTADGRVCLVASSDVAAAAGALADPADNAVQGVVADGGIAQVRVGWRY